MIFETERLVIRALQSSDRDAFYDLMCNPNVTNLIPQKPMDRKTSDENFEKHLNADGSSEKKVWAIDTKSGDIFVGLAAYLKNDKDEDEIGYRLREIYWGFGFGTEIAKGLIDYGFNNLALQIITADVNTANVRSVKILDRFLNRDFEFYNARDKCTDRRYRLMREEWK